MKKLLSYLLALSMVLSLFAGMTLTVSADTLDSEAGDENVTTLGDVLAASSNGSAEDTISQLYENFSSGFNEDGSVDNSIYDYDENQVSSDLDTMDDEDEDYPDAFDLRHVGGTVTYDEEEKQNDITGGLSYVTPVKFQNPWGTCWAFGICAASESSILYELGLGTEETANTNLDLSEHHLAWFAKNHIPAEGEEDYGVNGVNNQEGEGTWYVNGTTNVSMNGGTPFYGTSVFATGAGVVTEDYAPYYGKNQRIIVKRNADADEVKYPENTLEYDSLDAWNAETDEGIKDNYTPYCYSSNDDWSLDESMRFVQSYALEESSVLPDATPIVDEETGEVSLNEDGIEAIKSELTQGRAVEVAFCADNSQPTVSQGKVTRYINSNFAHYTWDSRQANHSVCIVGWDDDYSASNFGQENPVVYDANGNIVYKLKDSDQILSYDSDGYLYFEDEEGNPVYPEDDQVEVVFEEDASVSVPAGDGAWIVKNSWGSTDSASMNQNSWGVDGSGYFYLSYYDTSICMLETYDFAVTDDEEEEYDYKIIDQYDYLTASSSSQSVAYDTVMMANVFTAQEDMVIEAVSCETTTPGTSVIYGICLLDDDEDYPQAEDEVIMNHEVAEYTYGGYHREDLDTPLTVTKGQKYAVVAMEFNTVTDEKGNESDQYYICSNSAYSEDVAAIYGIGSYNVGVINPGESYILTIGYNSDDLVAIDYYEYITAVKKLNKEAIYETNDNFSLKAYAKPVTGTWKSNSRGWWYEYPDGSYVAGQWLEINGVWYYFDESGYMHTGWLKSGSAWYYLNANGSMATSQWIKSNNVWYYINEDGTMATSQWVVSNGSWYYLTSAGVMATSSYVKADGKDIYYWVNANGKYESQWNTATPNLNKYYLAY